MRSRKRARTLTDPMSVTVHLRADGSGTRVRTCVRFKGKVVREVVDTVSDGVLECVRAFQHDIATSLHQFPTLIVID
jgi:hypothetical protein